MTGPELRTERLLLRRWRDADRAPFAAVNADVAVMRHFAGPLDRAASDALIDRIERSFEEAGYSLWAVELPGEAACIGFVGLWRPAILAGVTDAVEVGWRLGSNRWGRGYATEGARRRSPSPSTSSASTRWCRARRRPTGPRSGSWRSWA